MSELCPMVSLSERLSVKMSVSSRWVGSGMLALGVGLELELGLRVRQNRLEKTNATSWEPNPIAETDIGLKVMEFLRHLRLVHENHPCAGWSREILVPFIASS